MKTIALKLAAILLAALTLMLALYLLIYIVILAAAAAACCWLAYQAGRLRERWSRAWRRAAAARPIRILGMTATWEPETPPARPSLVETLERRYGGPR